MRVGLGSVRIRGRGFVEKVLPEKLVPGLLGKEIFQVSKLKTKRTIDFVFPPAPRIILRPGRKGTGGIAGRPTERGFLSKGKFIAIPDDAVETKSFIKGPGYTTLPVGEKQRIFVPFSPGGPKQVSTASTTLTILPGRLQVLSRLKGKQQLFLPGFGSGLDVTDIVNRAGGRSVFPTSQTTLNQGISFVIARFEETVAKERGVTRAAERVRQRFLRLERVGVSGTRRSAANENFAELFMLFQRKDTKYRAQWIALQKTHPETLKRFFDLMEIFGITGT